MRTLFGILTAVVVIGLAYWAYGENYRTQDALSESRHVSNQIEAARSRLAVLRAEFAESVQVSALTGAGLDRLADRVVARRSGDWTELWLRVPHDQARLAALVHEHGEVILDRWTDDGWHAKVSVPKAVVWQLEGCVGVEDDPVLTAPEGEE